MDNSDYLQKKKFKEFDIADPFFDSLKSDYKGFEEWFQRKGDKEAFALVEKGVQGFLYLKKEDGPIADIDPVLDVPYALKIGTFKINPHGTRLGERFIKKAFDHAIEYKVPVIYLTIFKKYKPLIELICRYGFSWYGTKTSGNGVEEVYVKYLNRRQDKLLYNYPQIITTGVKKYLLAIYPKFHSGLFPDSILKTEPYSILDDVSYTNSIHKIYVTSMSVNILRPGDLIVIYRTTDVSGRAEYLSVATSICVVEEVRNKSSFKSFEEFYKYTEEYSILKREELQQWFRKNECNTIQMTYNIALKKRITRHVLADEIGLDRSERWSLVALTDKQFDLIIQKGEVDENIIIDKTRAY